VPPELVTVSERDWLFPIVTLPKLRLAGVDPSEPGASPIPESGTVSVEVEAFEVTVTIPLEVVADIGVNLTLKVVLCPAVKVKGVATLLRLNPLPLIPT